MTVLLSKNVTHNGSGHAFHIITWPKNLSESIIPILQLWTNWTSLWVDSHKPLVLPAKVIDKYHAQNSCKLMWMEFIIEINLTIKC